MARIDNDTMRQRITLICAAYIRLTERRGTTVNVKTLRFITKQYGFKNFSRTEELLKALHKMTDVRDRMRRLGKIPMKEDSCKVVFKHLGI